MAATSPEKREAIKKALRETRERRETQVCKVYELKLVRRRFSKKTCQDMFRMYLEAKWFRNAIVGSEELWNFDTSIKEVGVKVGQEFETRELRILGSQVKQSIHSQIKAEIKGLATKKKQGHRVGKLKFKSYLTSINLKQYGTTYRLTANGRLNLQNITQTLRVRGMKQIPDGAEFANAKLVHKHGDYYLCMTCYLTTEQLQAHHEKKRKTPRPAPVEALGGDLGIAHQLTLSNAVRIEYRVSVSPTIRKRHKQVSRKKKHSHNRSRARERLQKAYAHTTNIKKDIIHKLVAFFCLFTKILCVQNDCVKGWQRIWGRRIMETSIGGLLGKLMQLPNTVTVERFYASTQECTVCDRKTPHALDQRVFVCAHCGHTQDRDVNAAKNILHKGLKQIGAGYAESVVSPQGETESTPVDICASTKMLGYLNGIPYVLASRVEEAGSPNLKRTSDQEAQNL
jgi:putative transposase